MPIRILAPEVAAKIAAGEVVERPASVVKELVENALDAAATQIGIEVRGGGLRLIRVSDNGTGIPSEEVVLAFQRHATSKIHRADDLETIATLGFRGEALPSIAAVSELSLLTRTEQELAGSHLLLRDSATLEQTSRASPLGTTVTVRHLFRNFPARLKFLKTPATEAGRIVHVVTQYALAYPEVGFSLHMEERSVLRTPGNSNLKDVTTIVYGLEAGEAMRDVSGVVTEVSGMAGMPPLSRGNRNYMSFFVNRRWVQSRMLNHAVEEAYQGLLPPARRPVVVLNIALPLEEVDVNVHPAKSEVRFRHEGEVYGAVQRAIRSALQGSNTTPPLRRFYTPPTPSPPAPELPLPWAADTGSASPAPGSSSAAASLPGQEPTMPLRVLGQLAATYIIAEGPDGMYLIDQHTAHERLLFQRIRAQQSSATPEVQGLLEPLLMEVTPTQDQAVVANKEPLSQTGFGLEPFGERTYWLRQVPAVLSGKNIKAALLEVLDIKGGDEGGKDWQERAAASIACHGAVRAGQGLSHDEMRQLVRELEAAGLPRHCPHGRPIILHLSAQQLAKEFERG